MSKKIMSMLLAGIIAASTVVGSAAEDAPAAGIKFKADSGMKANLYTGYVEGLPYGATAGDVLNALEDRNGIEVIRTMTAGGIERAVAFVPQEDSAKIEYGDELVWTSTDGMTSVRQKLIFVGDSNMDSAFSLADVTTILKQVAGWKELSIDVIASDVDGDGSVGVKDVTVLLKVIAGWAGVEMVKAPTLPGTGNIATSLKLNAYSTSYDASDIKRTNLNLRKGQELGMKFSVPAGKYAKNVKAVTPSWANDKGVLRFSLFKWQGDYATTVAFDPIVTYKFVDFKDCGELEFKLYDGANKGIGEGEYLFLIHEGFDEKQPGETAEGVGVWQANCPLAATGVTVYFQGEAQDPADPDAFGFEATVNIGN